MRALLSALAALALAAPVLAVGPKPDITDWLAGPFAPHLMAWDMDERGLERYPFDPQDDYNNGQVWQVWQRVGHQFTEGGREANHVAAGLRLSERFGADLSYSKFRAGAFSSDRAPDWLSLHSTADLSTGNASTLEYGMGMATLQGQRSLWGFSLELRWERRLRKPWSLFLRYSPDLMSDGRLYHELSAGLGPSWGRFGVEAAYRALLNPLRDSYGPELALRLW
ncbi:MAG: hypothetical protein KGK30_02485 [Elusimicrobia bacterium]|nr:hypothetical protein [Elusimicrobiota bacterium]